MLSSAARFGVVHCATARKRESGGGDAPVATTDPAVSPTAVDLYSPVDVITTSGIWTGSGISYAYQWYNNADDTPLAGETTNTIPAARNTLYSNMTVYALVTATNSGGSVSARSSTTCYLRYIDG